MTREAAFSALFAAVSELNANSGFLFQVRTLPKAVELAPTLAGAGALTPLGDIRYQIPLAN